MTTPSALSGITKSIEDAVKLHNRLLPEHIALLEGAGVEIEERLDKQKVTVQNFSEPQIEMPLIDTFEAREIDPNESFPLFPTPRRQVRMNLRKVCFPLFCVMGYTEDDESGQKKLTKVYGHWLIVEQRMYLPNLGMGDDSITVPLDISY